MLIIGAGAAGGVAAKRLAASGRRVVCLEQGDWIDRGDYPGGRDDWELAARKQWAGAPNVRGLPADYPIDLRHSELAVSNFNAVGGSTILYAGVWPRLLPSDFRVRTLDGVADDWPIDYAELLPFYERTDIDFGVAGLGGNPAYPPGADPPLPPLPLPAFGRRVARAHAQLGWHWWPEASAIASNPYMGRSPCVQRGTCMSGCGEGAKASTDLTHWPIAMRDGAVLVTGARVRHITLDGRGRASGAVWIDRDGKERFQPADVVLCAANGIGTPRLLLHSACAAFPDGLANRSGLVGRRLMFHPSALVYGYWDSAEASWQGPAGGTLQSLEFYATDERRGFARGAKWTLAPLGGPVAVALRRGRDFAPFGAGHHDYFAARFGRGATWILLCEDLPDEANRVELSPTLADTDGIPAPAVHYRLHDNTRRLIEWQIERAKESFVAAGARFSEALVSPTNAHHMGTARMGDDPARSVVDRWCMSHDVANLGVIDGSVFVTGGAVNPTPTIAALALRAAERLIDRAADVPRPERPASVAVSFTPRTAPVPDTVPPAAAHPPPLTGDQRDRFARVADELIPGAAALGVATGPLDRVLTARPDLREGLLRALAFESVTEIKAADGRALDAVMLAAVAAYYGHATVRERIGYTGQAALPVPARALPDYLDDLPGVSKGPR